MTFPLTKLIHSALSNSPEPDLHVLARRVLTMIPPESRDEALAQCLYDRVRIENTRVRGSRSTLPEPVRKGESRWSRYPAALKVRYPVVGKVLADCTADDCDVIAADYGQRSAQLAALERRFLMLAAQLRSTGAATVGVLGLSDFDSLEEAA